MLRPRSSLARALYDKFKADEELKTLDKNEWYRVELGHVPPELRKTFLQLSVDEETEAFLQQSATRSSWVPTQIWHCMVKTFLKIFMTQTSINGTKPKLLDLGAGDGAVTSIIAPLFDEVYVTEVSPTMKWILAERGFRVFDVDHWSCQSVRFDVITCLNLLDRCDRPQDILNEMKEVLAPCGIVLLALVLPFKPYVELGTKNHSPCQILDIKGCTFESQVISVVKNVILPSGYEILKWTKLPYLCEGDLRQSYYWLDDVVFVLKKRGTRSNT